MKFEIFQIDIIKIQKQNKTQNTKKAHSDTIEKM